MKVWLCRFVQTALPYLEIKCLSRQLQHTVKATEKCIFKINVVANRFIQSVLQVGNQTDDYWHLLVYPTLAPENRQTPVPINDVEQCVFELYLNWSHLVIVPVTSFTLLDSKW